MLVNTVQIYTILNVIIFSLCYKTDKIMTSLILRNGKKYVEIIDNTKFITFTQFDDRKLITKYTEINIEKNDIEEVINALKKIIDK